MLNCKKASQLASRAMDEKLPFWKNLTFKFHLLLCRNCKNFTDQLEFLREASRRLTVSKEFELSAEAKHRIINKLLEN
ncbi:MAG: hypothetical protein H6936_10090 [Burkholderiales bacterium]|nr:hypothetical protein [Nitrosomonas sp.]MCP5275180.1 hypothetical protein [Burkholderiales bacterium]